MTTAKRIIPYRRKREGRTNYKKRLALLKSGLPRVVIRPSNKYIVMQLVEYQPDGDKITLTVSSKKLDGWKHGAKSLPAAYLTGLSFAKQTKAKKAIVDIGLEKHRAGTRICAAIKGLVDGGLDVPVSEEIFPKEDRLMGKHISDAVAKDTEAFAKRMKNEG